MKTILENTNIKELENDEYLLMVDNSLIKEKVNSIVESIHINDYLDYTIPNNDELITNIFLRIVTECFREKIPMVENKPYIINTDIDGVKYRLSLSKLKNKDDEKYMYGLIIK